MAEREGQSKHIEREFEIGKDEAWSCNMKRMYDEYQHESLESIRRNRNITDKLISDAQSHDHTLRQLSTQALQNAIETANMTGKQAVRHGDVAIDKQWNLEAEEGAAIGEVLPKSVLEAIRAMIVEAVGQNIKK